MPQRMRTCPLCHTRVLPTPDQKCPACRSYDFAAGVGAAPVSGGPSSLRPAPNLYEGAVLHWRLFWLIAAFLCAALLRISFRLGYRPWDLDPDLSKVAIAVAGMVVAVWMVATSFRLARWLGLSSGWNFYRVLKESATFFEEKGVRSNLLGPYLSAVPGRPKGVLEEDESVLAEDEIVEQKRG